MYKNLLFFFVLCLCFPLAAQQWSWASDVGRYFITQSQLRIKTNDAGDIFTSGSFSGRVTLGDTSFFKDTSYYGNHAAYVARFTAENQIMWAQLIDGVHTLVYDMTVDDRNRTFVVGYYESDLILADTILHDGPKNFMISYTGNGSRRWMKTFSRSWMWNDKMVIDHDRNVVYEYNTLDSLMIEKRNGGTGELLWRKSFLPCSPAAMCVDSKNNILLAIPWGTDTFKIGGMSYPPVAGCSKLTYLVTLNNNGDASSAECWLGVTHAKLGVDSDDNIYVAGYFHGNMKIRNWDMADDGGNYNDPFVARLNTRGGCSWMYGNGAAGVWLSAMDVTPSGEIYCAGSFSDSLRFPGFNLHESNTRYALYVMKFDRDGHAIWSIKNGGGDGSDAIPYSIAANNSGGMVLAGVYHTYMSAQWFGNDTLANTAFHDDIFLARADESVVSTIKNVPFANTGMNIYPNPCDGTFSIASPKNFENGTVVIYDAMGNLCFRKDRMEGSAKINASLHAGLYLVEVSDGNKKVCRRLVVE